MKIDIRHDGHSFILEGAIDLYNETTAAEPSGRLLAGSRDAGFDTEYIGYGDVLGIPVKAVYLLTPEDYYPDEDGNPDEDAGAWDWDMGLANGRLEIMADKLSDCHWQLLKTI